jgi:hypothetical protein
MSKPQDQQPKEILNVPAGNSAVTEEARPIRPEDRRTGDFKQDFWAAFRVSVMSRFGVVGNARRD